MGEIALQIALDESRFDAEALPVSTGTNRVSLQRAVTIDAVGVELEEPSRDDLMVRVHKISGDLVLEEVMRVDSRVMDIKRRIREVDASAHSRHVLTTHASERPLLDTDILARIMEFLNLQGEALEVHLAIHPTVPVSERSDVIMNISHDTLDTMSNSSGQTFESNLNWDRPLFDFQGRWRACSESIQVLRRAFGDNRALGIRVRGSQA